MLAVALSNATSIVCSGEGLERRINLHPQHIFKSNPPVFESGRSCSFGGKLGEETSSQRQLKAGPVRCSLGVGMLKAMEFECDLGMD